ncbi:MAG: DNA-processing protein DprA [Burkholderiales bacterium]|nr:DNA-processing protein DprA [Burkholderiales bacterium]
MAVLGSDLEAWLRLTLIPGLGDVYIRRLLTALGSPERVFSSDRATLSKLVPGRLASALLAGPPDEAPLRQTEEWLQDPANRIVTLADTAYPQALLQTVDPPSLLYVKGRVELLNRAGLAIVGSRNATPQGAATAESFARALSDAGLPIVSGLATGIDAAAHRGGLAGGSSSIAVIGTGADIVYPARNRELAHQLAAQGAIVSEFPLGTPALGANFPRRNRIISGLTRGCLVIEAALQSGSLITARLANEQGKDVFAIPGSIHSPLSKGCHQLIKQGAKLVDSAQDVLEELDLVSPAATDKTTTSPADADAQTLLEHLGFDPGDIDTICARSGLKSETVSALLLQLEIDGRVARLPGGRFQRLL